MRKFFKTLGPTLLSLGTFAATQVAPAAQAYIAAHPKWSAAAASVGWIAAHWLPSPLHQKND
jgi:hypothetical protein